MKTLTIKDFHEEDEVWIIKKIPVWGNNEFKWLHNSGQDKTLNKKGKITHINYTRKEMVVKFESEIGAYWFPWEALSKKHPKGIKLPKTSKWKKIWKNS